MAFTNKPVQKRLLAVGLDLLRPGRTVDDGGLLVYSTCSLEVVREALGELNRRDHCAARYELVDLSGRETAGSSGVGEERRDDGAGTTLTTTDRFLRVLPADTNRPKSILP